MTNFTQVILEYLRLKPKGWKLPPKQVAQRLEIRKRDFPEFLTAWIAAIADRQSEAPRRDRKPTKDASLKTRSESASQSAPTGASGAGLLKGVIKRVGLRGGIFITHSARGKSGSSGAVQEILIDPSNLSDAQAGDSVVVEISSWQDSRGKLRGRVVEVLERATNTFVGSYDEFDGQGYVKIDGRNFTDPIWVGDPGAKGAAPGDKVVVEMIRFPTHAQGGEAVLTQVLGEKGKPGVDVLTILHEFGLPDDFSAETLHDASEQAAKFDESSFRDRSDLTRDTIITIDPVDARDFDDAISLTKNEAGHWRLGVHIADVAHFVPLGSELDREARRRGTSVYLPTRVIPMLPEVISNGLASLQQGRVRYTNSVFIEFTPAGIPVDTELAKTAIKVTRRFAYEEVMPILEQPEAHAAKVPAKVRQLLTDMRELAATLRERRFAKGALNLNLPEVKLDFDADGRVVGAHEVASDESHQIIEEFMLAANIAVATKLNDLGTLFLRRVHSEPDSLKLQNLAKFVAALGFAVAEKKSVPEKAPKKWAKKGGKPVRTPSPTILSKEALQTLLKQVHGTPAEHAVNYALLRSLKQAEYSGQPIGHYALAAPEYCHFTSPIRRYPDLTVHRLFDEFVTTGRPRSPSEAELEILGQHCSDMERRAAGAERELTKLKLLAFMAERVGEELDAIITGVERFGLFCQGIEIPVSGFVHITVLSEKDYFDFDQDSVSLISRRTGQRLRLGDRVRVKVAHVDPDRRELDFRIVSRRDSEQPAIEGQAPKARRRPTESGRNAKTDRPKDPANAKRKPKRGPPRR